MFRNDKKFFPFCSGNHFHQSPDLMMPYFSHKSSYSATKFKVTIAKVLIDVSLTVKAATLIFISERGSAISSAEEGKSGSFIIW